MQESFGNILFVKKPKIIFTISVNVMGHLKDFFSQPTLNSPLLGMASNNDNGLAHRYT